MSFNSSNASLLPPRSSNSCMDYRSSFFIFIAFCFTNTLVLLPHCILVLSLGVQRWRRQHSAPASHSDIFTYHMAAMDTLGIAGCGLCSCAAFIRGPWWMMLAGAMLVTATSYGQIPFHILTCVERHLAVVHPITYLGLRKRGGVRIRNVSIGCVWLLFLSWFGLISLNDSIVLYFCFTTFSIAVISFCSLSVLRALIRPGPGEGGGVRERVDRSKMRAFRTIMAIMVALLVRFVGHLLVLLIFSSREVSEDVRCGLLVSGVWLCLPSSLVLPLLFLHRAGKLPCCRKPHSAHGGLQTQTGETDSY